MTKQNEITQEEAKLLLEMAWEAINLIDLTRNALPRTTNGSGESLYKIAGDTRDRIFDVIMRVEG